MQNKHRHMPWPHSTIPSSGTGILGAPTDWLIGEETVLTADGTDNAVSTLAILLIDFMTSMGAGTMGTASHSFNFSRRKSRVCPMTVEFSVLGVPSWDVHTHPMTKGLRGWHLRASSVSTALACATSHLCSASPQMSYRQNSPWHYSVCSSQVDEFIQ